MKPVIEEAVIGLLNLKPTDVPSSMVIADLGCSNGPNALALVTTAVDALLHRFARQHNQAPLELRLLLNDLPDNDFNDVAKRLVLFQQSTQSSGVVLTGGIVPGSFYKRLFPSNSLDLVLSSNSLHWVSEAPEDLKSDRIPLYDDDEGLRRARRHLVIQAYSRQFSKDFTLFLSLRAQELVPGGRMVISIAGSRAYQCGTLWDIVNVPLNDMASRQSLVSREMLDCFYVPLYAPSDLELRKIIQDEGSFEINKMQLHEMELSLIAPNTIAYAFRAVFEPMIVQHFGLSGDVMDEFVRTLEQHLVQGSPQLTYLLGDTVSVCISLTRF
ncbi:Salicylate/benzoate carboxyl methyltransferase [Dichanthelium oligosanthes]|uniref:Salicylate/benzoate carboxyl methyltransferase n=1 Tax=Dichanthelium oligosanthes TaxID=888268 RepID=A0A1E5W7W7_9POAL|nr:Salicylate/benzoate carboxyl methyltransferase [Dichanthelium oligosanthes]